ncbi:MAG TPA: hypothetical protein VMG62_02580, partial [Solirubrobacteraceae bacterium]|nr:hypothetical protein [Solirubrobacteraceae bacterium]
MPDLSNPPAPSVPAPPAPAMLGPEDAADPVLAPDYLAAPLAEVDPEVARALHGELQRQRGTLEMIASENFVP